MLGIEDEWAAYQLDLACIVAVNADDSERPRVRKPRKATPLRHMARKAQIPESGIW